MHALFCHDKFYIKGRDENVYSYGSFSYSLWEHRFLPHFSFLTVIGVKHKKIAEETGLLDLSSGKGVDHILLPNINSPLKRLVQSLRVYRKIKEQVALSDAVIIRGPIEYGIMAARAARSLKKPYAVEMTSCAYDVNYFNGSFLGRLYAPIAFRMTQKMVKHANAVMYVTESFLQSRYPTNGVSSYAPNVEISAAPEYVFENRLVRIKDAGEPITFGLIGNFIGGFRGLDIAFEALGIVRQMAIENESLLNFKFKILGNAAVAQWKELIEVNQLQDHVEFCGSVPRGAAVLEWLDDVDVYLQPSPHQGLPRTMLEAMSRGCLVLASDAGGAPELIENQYIHPRGDAQVLASHIIGVLQGKHREEQARRNFKKAKQYSTEFLAPKRHQFWADFASLAQERKN